MFRRCPGGDLSALKPIRATDKPQNALPLRVSRTIRDYMDEGTWPTEFKAA